MTELYKEGNVIKTFNVGLIVTMFLLFALGLATLFSAIKGPGLQTLYKTQLVWFILGLVIGAVIIFIDSQVFEKVAYLSYGVSLILLFLVLVIGRVGGGAQRWLSLGPIHLQPSEFAKIALVFALAKFFADDKEGPPYTLRRLLIPGIFVLPLFALTIIQPDLGTAGVIALIATSMILFVGVSWKSIFIVTMSAMITIPVAYKFVLREYQRERVKTFIDPGRDAKGSGYNALQCRIAVGSGKVFGKSYLEGTQAQLNFIPEQHTAFIFSVYAEERGFLGTLLLLLMYGLYCFFALRTVARARAKFEMLLALGLASIIFWHAFINTGMVSGILPIVGVGLPFFSYGGSSLLTFMTATALILNLGRKKYIF